MNKQSMTVEIQRLERIHREQNVIDYSDLQSAVRIIKNLQEELRRSSYVENTLLRVVDQAKTRLVQDIAEMCRTLPAQASNSALYSTIVEKLTPYFDENSRDLEWDVLPSTLVGLCRELKATQECSERQCCAISQLQLQLKDKDQEISRLQLDGVMTENKLTEVRRQREAWLQRAKNRAVEKRKIIEDVRSVLIDHGANEEFESPAAVVKEMFGELLAKQEKINELTEQLQAQSKQLAAKPTQCGYVVRVCLRDPIYRGWLHYAGEPGERIRYLVDGEYEDNRTVFVSRYVARLAIWDCWLQFGWGPETQGGVEIVQLPNNKVVETL